jgi:hypothetical protein
MHVCLGTHDFRMKIVVGVLSVSNRVCLSTKYVLDRLAYKAHVQDEYTILPSGRLVISARVWRTVIVSLPLHYVSIRRPDDIGHMVVSPTLSHPNLKTNQLAPSTKAMDGSYGYCRGNRCLGPECWHHWQRWTYFSRTGNIHSDMVTGYSCCGLYQGYYHIPVRVIGKGLGETLQYYTQQ